MSGPNGAVDPLGVVLTPRGVEVAVYSAHASAVFFCLYDEAGERETERVRLHADANGLHSASIDGVGAGARYGLRADGPFDPQRGARFDVSKLLVDPYAVEIDRPFRLHPSMFAFGVDSGPFAPKSIALAPALGAPGRQRISWERTVVYEANIRGLTKLCGDVPEAARGCFAGLAHPHVIAHLSALGVTTVEFMPADAFVDARHLPPLGLADAWGYNPVVLGAPDPRLAPGGWAEVRMATDALHAAGLEAILDVVLNHNGESDEFGPTLSFRGLDNATYFRLAPDDLARYVNDMGTGNCLALDRPVVARMALAALKRWMVFGGVQGVGGHAHLRPAPGREARIGRAEDNRVVTPSVGKAERRQMARVDEGVGGHEFDGGDAERAQVRDDVRMRKAGETASRRLGDVARFGQAANVGFVDNGALPGYALTAGSAERGRERDRFGRERPAVDAEGEHRRVQAKGSVDFDRIGIDEQLRDVEAGAALRVERAVGAQAIARARPDAVDRSAVEAVGVGVKAHAFGLALAGFVIKAEKDGAGMGGINRDLDPARCQDDAERVDRAVRPAHGAARVNAR